LKEEIFLYHGEVCSRPQISEALDHLLHNNMIYFIDGFYALHNDISLATKRKNANKLAAQQMITAHKAAKILSRFPYVRGLAISGSLSKNYGSEKTDIDFFIITSANRLWIARTMMHLYKKITFLTGRHNWFCMNYYVDEANPVIEEKNIFTALEIVTLLPMYGRSSFENFIQANSWVNEYFPVCNIVSDKTPELNRSWLGRMIEKIFNNGLGNSVDNRLMMITDKRWKRKTAKNKKNEKGNVLAMMVNKHCSKPNPKNFQDKVVKEFRSKLDNLLYPKTLMRKAV
jgi:hypothetical protein